MDKQAELEVKCIWSVKSRRKGDIRTTTVCTFEDEDDANKHASMCRKLAQGVEEYEFIVVSEGLWRKTKERIGLKIVELIQALTNVGYSVTITKDKDGMRIVCKMMEHGIVQLNTVVTGTGKELEKKIIATLEDFRKDVYDED